MMKKNLALGKGLGALISDAAEINRNGQKHRATFAGEDAPSSEANSPASVSEIPVEKIVTNPYQPRTTFDEDALTELCESIKVLGLVQPVTVRQIGAKYQIISGERRFRASKMAGLEHIPAYIVKTDDQGMLEMAIVENIQREDLNVMEIALSYRRLIEECNLTQEQMADRVGKKRTSVTNFLRLLKLPAAIQAALREGLISMGHAKCILSLEKDADKEKFCELTIRNDWSVRMLETRIKAFLAPGSGRDASVPELPDMHYRVADLLGRYFNNNVTVKRTEKGSGSVTIRFSSDDEIEAFLKVLEKNA